MRKMLLGVLAGGLALLATTAMPAHAGPAATWSDPDGDANGFFVTDSGLPLPNEPSLDVISASLSSDGKNLKYVAKVKQLAATPPVSTGYFIRLAFSYQEVPFEFQISEDTVLGNGTYLSAPDDQTATLDCSGCIGKIDRAKNEISFTASLLSVSRGMRGYDNSLKTLGPGSKFTALGVTAQRSIAGTLTPSADTADAPETTTFTF